MRCTSTCYTTCQETINRYYLNLNNQCCHFLWQEQSQQDIMSLLSMLCSYLRLQREKRTLGLHLLPLSSSEVGLKNQSLLCEQPSPSSASYWYCFKCCDNCLIEETSLSIFPFENVNEVFKRMTGVL